MTIWTDAGAFRRDGGVCVLRGLVDEGGNGDSNFISLMGEDFAFFPLLTGEIS